MDIKEKLKKLPKLRGRGVAGLRTIQTKPSVVNLAKLEMFFQNNETVTPAALLERGLVRLPKAKSRSERKIIKILGDGTLTKKITVSGCLVSKSAKEKIEKVGGSVQ